MISRKSCDMNYNQYTNPKATQISRNLAVVTFVSALIGILTAVGIIAMGGHPLWSMLIIVLAFALFVFRPRIEAFLVKKLIEDDSGNTGDPSA